MLSWTKERPDYWVADGYAVAKVSSRDSPKGHEFHVVSPEKDFLRDRRHATLRKAQDACEWDAGIRATVADAPPLSQQQRDTIATIFAAQRRDKAAAARKGRCKPSTL